MTELEELQEEIEGLGQDDLTELFKTFREQFSEVHKAHCPDCDDPERCIAEIFIQEGLRNVQTAEGLGILEKVKGEILYNMNQMQGLKALRDAMQGK